MNYFELIVPTIYKDNNMLRNRRNMLNNHSQDISTTKTSVMIVYGDEIGNVHCLFNRET